MKEPKPMNPRGRGTYTPKACKACRQKKVKCSGTSPACASCLASGQECLWTGETAKRPINKAYVDSLWERIRILEMHVSRCNQEHGHGGFTDLPPVSSPISDDIEGMSFSDDDEDSEDRLRALIQEGYGDLQLYGSTSIFQFAPKDPNVKSRFPEIIEKTHECYILLVEGVDDSHYNPDLDWSRYLPAEVPLDRREHDRLLDLLFRFCTSWCLRIVRPLFLRDMWLALISPSSHPPPKTTHYSPMLHNALMALATAYSDNPRIRDFKSRQYFVQAAKSYIDKECQNPNISVMHALSILGSYHASQGDQTLGYMYFGMSGRITQALGLSVDCSPWVKANWISHDDMLDRNWAHWTTFCQDVCWSLYVGREFCVPEANRSTIPVPFVDSDFDEIEWFYPPSGLAPQPTYLSRTFAETCELFRIGRRIISVVNLVTLPGARPDINHQAISDLDDQLNTWKERLFPEVAIDSSNKYTAMPHRLMIHLVFWQMTILLHRPFYRRAFKSLSDRDLGHVKTCNYAAENILDLLDTWRTLYTLRYVPVALVHVIFSAGTIFLWSAIQATSSPRFAQVSLRAALQQAEVCIQYLHEVGRSFPCAKNVAGILANLIQQQLQPKLTGQPLMPSRPPSPKHAGNGLQMSSISQTRANANTSPAALKTFSKGVAGPPTHDGQPPIVAVYYQKYVQGGSHMHVEQSSGCVPAIGPPVHPDSNGNATAPPLLPIHGGYAGSAAAVQATVSSYGKTDASSSNLPFMPFSGGEPNQYDPTYLEQQLGLPQGEDVCPPFELPEEMVTDLGYFLIPQPHQFLSS